MALRTSITVDLQGNFVRKARQIEMSMHRMALGGRRDLGVLRGMATSTGNALDRMGNMANRYTVLAAGVAGIGVGRQLINMEQRFMRIGIQADISKNQVKQLKDEIFSVANMKGINVDPMGITGGVEKILSLLGDYKLARGNIRNIAMLMQATGANGEDAGAMIANMSQKFGISSPKQILAALSTLDVQGKGGSFELQDMASQGPRIMAAYARTGRSGMLALREMGAILQEIRSATGSADEATTSFERLIQTITSQKTKKLEAYGIQIWDPKQLKQGKKVARSIIDIVEDIVRKTKADPELLSQIFGQRAIRAVNPFAIEYKNTGGFASMDSYFKMQDNGTTIMRDSARASESASAAIQHLATAWTHFSDTRLTDKIDDVSHALNALSSSKMDSYLSAAGDVALAAGVAYAGRRIYRGLGGLGGRWGKLGGLSGKLGGLSESLIPIPSSTIGGYGRPGRLSKLARFGGKAVGVIGAASGVISAAEFGWQIGSAMEKAFIGGRWGSDLYDLFHGNDKKTNAAFRERYAEMHARSHGDAHIKLEISHAGNVHVKSMHMGPGQQADVYQGVQAVPGSPQ